MDVDVARPMGLQGAGTTCTLFSLASVAVSVERTLCDTLGPRFLLTPSMLLVLGAWTQDMPATTHPQPGTNSRDLHDLLPDDSARGLAVLRSARSDRSRSPFPERAAIRYDAIRYDAALM